MTKVVIRRVPCLSDGAMASLREDLAEAKSGEPMVLAWNCVLKALEEIEWLRAREMKLQRQLQSDRADDPEVQAITGLLMEVREALGCDDMAHPAAEVRKLKERADAFADKAIAYDLDQAGIESRTADAVELVELRAKVEAVQSRANDWAVRAATADCERMQSKTRVAELDHSLADAITQIEAIQGSNATHMASVAKLETKLEVELDAHDKTRDELMRAETRVTNYRLKSEDGAS